MAGQAADGAGGKPRARPGRKFGPVRARSQEYEALAHFLRQRVQEAGLTLGELEAASGLRKSAIGERLSGEKLDADFVDAVVLACTNSTSLLPRRARLRHEGARLLEIAQSRSTAVLDVANQPAAVRNVAVDAQNIALKAQAKLLDLQEVVDRKNDELATLAQVQQQSQLALRDADTLSSVLSTWVVVLADEVERLTQDRELAMTARPPDLTRLTRVDAELARTVARHDRTAAELARARQERQLATMLLAETLTRTRRVRDDMRRLRAATQLAPADDTASGERSSADLNGFASPSVFGADIDAALDRAEAIGRTIAARLHMALTALDEGAETVTLSTSFATDNAVTDADTEKAATDEALRWDLLANVPTEAFVWAEETAAALAGDRDPHDPLFEHIAKVRPVPEAILLADRLQEHRWLEGAARLRTALALSAPLEELVPLVGALIKAGTFLNRAEQGAQILRVALAGRTDTDTVALHNEILAGDDIPPILRKGLASLAQRPYSDVVALLRKQLAGNSRPLRISPMMEAIVRTWPPGVVVDLAKDVGSIKYRDLVGPIFEALPVPPTGHTELLVRLWDAVEMNHYHDEHLLRLYPAGEAWTAWRESSWICTPTGHPRWTTQRGA